MTEFLTFYGGMAAVTFLWGIAVPRPATAGEWLGLVLISGFWPLFMLYVVAGEGEP